MIASMQPKNVVLALDEGLEEEAVREEAKNSCRITSSSKPRSAMSGMPIATSFPKAASSTQQTRRRRLQTNHENESEVADIAERARDPRLQALYDEGVNVYSFSKLGTINSCLYGAWRTYILHDRGSGSVYTELGTASHQAIEDFIEGKIDKSGMLPIFESGVEQCEMLGFDFPKDFKGGNSIRNRYLSDLKNCFQTFTMPKGKFTVEELLILRVSPTRAMQGYSDLLRWNNDGTVTVLDIKSSSDYAQKDLLEHGRQLTIYGMALEQAGYKVKSTAWIMLKYVVIKYDWYATRRGKNKTPLTRIVNRSKIYDTIKDAVEAACREAGMDEMDIEIAMMDFAKTNILAICSRLRSRQSSSLSHTCGSIHTPRNFRPRRWITSIRLPTSTKVCHKKKTTRGSRARSRRRTSFSATLSAGTERPAPTSRTTTNAPCRCHTIQKERGGSVLNV